MVPTETGRVKEQAAEDAMEDEGWKNDKCRKSEEKDDRPGKPKQGGSKIWHGMTR